MELDVRRAAGGHLVVHHDPELADGRRVLDLHPSRLPSHVPSLAEALDSCGDIAVNVELKELPGEPGFDESGAFESQVVETALALGRTTNIWYSSFWPPAVDAVSDHPSRPVTGLLLMELWADLDRIAREAEGAGHTALHPDESLVDHHFMASARAHRLEVHVWTVNDPDRMAQLVDLGVDSIITDEVALALSVVGTDGKPDR